MSSMNRSEGFVPLSALTVKPPGLWRDLEELHGERELATDLNHAPEPDGESRRRFLSLLAGSLALAGVTGCTRQPTETIMPYVEAPENVIPGRPRYYATAAVVNGI